MATRADLRDVTECVRQHFSGQRVYVAGHRGMVGAALVRALEPLEIDLVTRTKEELDLRDQATTEGFFRTERPTIVLFAAATVGGIQANSMAPADFLYDNLTMATHAIQAAYEHGTAQFVFLGSTCIYPRTSQQPIPEPALLTGELEPTNEAYALAKIAGLKLCQYYRRQYGVLFHSLMPTNLYGPGDNYHGEHSHVLPALIARFHEAMETLSSVVVIWGTGKPIREFLHVDDLASAVLHVAALNDPPNWVNVGSGQEVSVVELAQIVADVVGFQGEIRTDPTMPDGVPRKLADSTLLRSTGWEARIGLREGIAGTYEAFLEERDRGLLRAK
jgi:GDP-L-fucose synthase